MDVKLSNYCQCKEEKGRLIEVLPNIHRVNCKTVTSTAVLASKVNQRTVAPVTLIKKTPIVNTHTYTPILTCFLIPVSKVFESCCQCKHKQMFNSVIKDMCSLLNCYLIEC